MSACPRGDKVINAKVRLACAARPGDIIAKLRRPCLCSTSCVGGEL
jgi:hypothetical protein